jgi:hypothetical protein
MLHVYIYIHAYSETVQFHSTHHRTLTCAGEILSGHLGANVGQKLKHVANRLSWKNYGAVSENRSRFYMLSLSPAYKYTYTNTVSINDSQYLSLVLHDYFPQLISTTLKHQKSMLSRRNRKRINSKQASTAQNQQRTSQQQASTDENHRHRMEATWEKARRCSYKRYCTAAADI